MSDRIRRIGVLTGGGDCPGLNAVIRAVTKAAIYRHGLEVVGIEEGFLGLIHNRVRNLTPGDVSNILTLGGTILGTTNRADPTRYVEAPGGGAEPRDVTDTCFQHLRLHRIDALVLIGGDGTMTVAARFAKRGINCIGVPKTIDNDIVGTDVSFGFATATAIATDALDRIHTTAASHQRGMVVEVMGRNAGWLALHAGIASGADVILLPEIPYDPARVCEHIDERARYGKRFTVLAVAEGARPVDGRVTVQHHDPLRPEPIRLGGVGQVVADQVQRRIGVETRCTILGHVQRGGTPVATDRVLATEFGCAAVEALIAGKCNRMIAMHGRTVTDVDIMTAAGKQRIIPARHPLLGAARAIGTSFGD